MNILINQKNKFIIFIFTIYIFFWSFNIFGDNILRYLILIPFVISIFDINFKNKSNLYRYLIIPLFLLIHYLLTNFINSTPILLRDFIAISFISIIIFTFLFYRSILFENIANILKIYFLLLIIFSMLTEKSFDVGSCSSSFFYYFPLLKDISISKGFFLENSHLAMVNIAAILSGYYYFFKKKDFLILILASSSLIINIFNLSTTFLAGYIICSMLFFFICKNFYFKIFIFISSTIFAIFLYFSHDCNKKYSYINFDDIKNETIQRDKTGELTSNIYERSIIISINTLKNYPLGWGYDGSIKATKNYLQYLKDKKSSGNIIYEYRFDRFVWNVNLRDALGNIFKILIEFGYLSLPLMFLFFFYIKNNKISEFEIFIISIFIVQLFRGAGYINGGFILAFSEIFLSRYFIINNLHLNKKSPN